MTLVADEVQVLFQILESDPEWRDRFRLLLVDDTMQSVWDALNRLTGSVERLAQAQMETVDRLSRVEAVVADLAEAQRRAEERISRLEAVVAELAEAQRRAEERISRLEAVVADLAEAQRRAEERISRMEDRLSRLEAVVAELAEAQRRAEERISRMEDRLSRLEAVVAELAEAQRRAEERISRMEDRLSRLEAVVADLAEAQRRAEERLSRLETSIQHLIEQVDRLVGWQQGTAGRLEGEHYERMLVKRAPVLFNRGQGGATDNPFVQEWLSDKLQHLLAEGELKDDENPFLADLIWRKGDQVLVVEASIHVDRRDVQRAALRAEVLRRVGLQARGMVVGEGWFGPSAREQAQALGVEWKVGDDYSEGWIAFRRLPAE
jgi:predicted nuclease with TOPRIM domain